MSLKIIKTKDGSHTLHDDALNEIYHSVEGAVQESIHVYIRAGYQLARSKFKTINLLEIGFGTGLNTWITLLESYKENQAINYITLEPFPIPVNIYKQLNYPNQSLIKGNRDLFLQLHEQPWNEDIRITEYFTLSKHKTSIEKFIFESNNIHLVYFDAFAPDIQPELWKSEIFIKLYDLMAIGGILVTYSAKGLVRRNLLQSGFRVERIEGPPGKREMLRATK